MRVAQHRSKFPTLIAEFDTGRLSLEQVEAAIAAPAWAEAKIVDLVQIATVTKIRRAVRSNQFEHDPDAPPADNRSGTATGSHSRSAAANAPRPNARAGSSNTATTAVAIVS